MTQWSEKAAIVLGSATLSAARLCRRRIARSSLRALQIALCAGLMLTGGRGIEAARAAGPTALRCDGSANQFGNAEPFTVSIRLQPGSRRHWGKAVTRGGRKVYRRISDPRWRVSVVGRGGAGGRKEGWTLRLAGRLASSGPGLAGRAPPRHLRRQAHCQIAVIISEAIRSGLGRSAPSRAASPAIQAGLRAAEAPSGGRSDAHFSVDGVSLGGTVDWERSAHRSFQCQPHQFLQGHRSCTRVLEQTARSGRQTRSTVVVAGPDGVRSISLAIEPAIFKDGDVEREVERLSRLFGAAPQLIRFHRDTRDGVIAAWSGITLTRLDAAAAESLRPDPRGGTRFDYLADEAKSARENLPIYTVGGHAGYIWSALYDQTGRGVLHVLAIDPNAFAAPRTPATAAAQPSVPAPARSQPPAPVAASPAPQVAQPPQAVPPPQAAPPAGPQVAVETAIPGFCDTAGQNRPESLRLTAQQLLDDAARLVGNERDARNLQDVVRGIAALQHALAADDTPALARQITTLRAALADDPRYAELLSRRSDEDRRKGVPVLRRESRSAKRYANFIVDYVKQNPRSPHAVELLDLKLLLEHELSRPAADPGKLQCLNQQVSRRLNALEISGLLGVRAWIFRLKRAAAGIAPSREQ